MEHQIQIGILPAVPLGFLSFRALVRHRNAFRYGFQFFDPDPESQELIKRTATSSSRTLPFRQDVTPESWHSQRCLGEMNCELWESELMASAES